MKSLSAVGILALVLNLTANLQAQGEASVTGLVYEDPNRNGQRDPGEPGIGGILVSNQRQVVQTDAQGRYQLPLHSDETVIFVIKPADYAVPLNEDNLPQFYYIHQPEGSPDLKYPGVPPTGPLPASVDFPLYKTAPTDTFDVIVFTDPQPLSHDEVNYIRDDVVAELVDVEAAFGMTLGDIMYDDLSLFPRYNAIVGKIGIPFYNCPGNHDLNYDAPDDRHALETFKGHFGPPYYALEYGRVSFVILKTMEWLGGDDTGNYHGKISEEQLQWLQNYLKFVPEEQLIVFAMHIPIYFSGSDDEHVNVLNRASLFEVLADRKHLLALAGHLHMIEYSEFGEELGCRGEATFRQWICAAVSGSWWSGPKDERGVPTTDQRDGAPNGYHIFTFAGNQYTQRFKAASRGDDDQMRISSPSSILTKAAADTTRIVVNVFNGNRHWKVTCRVDDGAPIAMTQTRMKDPFVVRLRKTHEDSYPEWIQPQPTAHIWTAPLPSDVQPGVHTIRVEALEPGGGSHTRARVFEIRK